MDPVVSYYDETLEAGEAELVREYPLKLVVNGREIATLVCSPHDLHFLAVGFLRLQGFLRTADDLLDLEVSDRTGTARVTLRGEVPETLRPVLTSGGGAGIGFAPDRREGCGPALPVACRRPYRPADVFRMMEQMARLSVNYTRHGGTHSSAVGDGGAIRLHAEDLGRHNTLDRIAGEALLKRIDLSCMMLTTSGRVPTEMVAKAAALGVSLIASRTTPTDRAAAMCRAAGVALVGYVRVGRFTVYACPERIAAPCAAEPAAPRM